MKNKKILFDWGWRCKGPLDLLPAISLNNYYNQFDIDFRFLVFWFEITFIKERWT